MARAKPEHRLDLAQSRMGDKTLWWPQRRSLMDINIGAWDRALRIGVGGVLVGLAATSLVGPWGYIGVLPLLTGLFRQCPAYRLLGFSTCAKER
jgi:hypothetical protein